jgi:hypothetical protein
MKRGILILLAAILFIAYGYMLNQWLHSGHSWQYAWEAARSDWFVAGTLFDTLLFALICMIWMVRDMKKKRYPVYKIMAMALACMIAGMPSFLIYLAFRQEFR